MSIYIMTHKKFEPFTNSTDYKTILVGADFNKADRTYIKDTALLEIFQIKMLHSVN